jgi:hypothetical protein
LQAAGAGAAELKPMPAVVLAVAAALQPAPAFVLLAAAELEPRPAVVVPLAAQLAVAVGAPFAAEVCPSGAAVAGVEGPDPLMGHPATLGSQLVLQWQLTQKDVALAVLAGAAHL